jgi:methylmalonyl-CoA/ethylmalonyl-CoA epimerase
MNVSYPLDHVAVAVPSLEEGCRLFKLLAGEPCSQEETLRTQGVRVAFAGALEILEPLGPETPVGRFLQRRGPGLHHIAFRVPELAGTLTRLEAEGIRLIDRVPRKGARGHQVAFIHPESTGGVLVELVENSSPTGLTGS